MSWENFAHGGNRRASGLLLLRVGLTLTLLHLAQTAEPPCPPWAWWAGGAVAAGLLLGLLSCPCALACLLWAATGPAGSWLLAACVAAQALAVMLLGAGRWSVDRWLFGRRLVFESDDTFR